MWQIPPTPPVIDSKVTTDKPPTLTELESTKLELYATQLGVEMKVITPIQNNLFKLNEQIQQEHPGWTLDPHSLSLVRAQPTIRPQVSRPKVSGPNFKPGPVETKPKQ
jgi:hypothetical protein